MSAVQQEGEARLSRGEQTPAWRRPSASVTTGVTIRMENTMLGARCDVGRTMPSVSCAANWPRGAMTLSIDVPCSAN